VRAQVRYALDLVEELCVGDIALGLGATEDAVGYGSKLLRTAGLVATRKQGRVVSYRLADDFPAPLLELCLRQLVRLSRTDNATDSTEPSDTGGAHAAGAHAAGAHAAGTDAAGTDAAGTDAPGTEDDR